MLSHPEVGLQTAGIYFVFWAIYGRNALGVRNAVFVALITILLTAPWWLTVLRFHGFSPFQSAMQTGIRETLFASFFHAFFSTQGDLPLLPIFSLIGIIVVLRKRDFLLVLWAVVPFFVDPRNAPAIAIFPFLMLTSEGMYYSYTQFLRASTETFQRNENASRTVSFLSQGSLAVILIYFFFVSCRATSFLAAISISVSDRETMAWVRKNTLPVSRFLLLTNVGNISPMADSYQEWFPVLAERQSQNTLQGMEWILGSNFFPYSQRLVALQACPDVNCLNDWLQQNNVHVDFVLFQTKRASQRLMNSVEADKRFDTVYESADAKIFAVPP